MNDTPNPSLFRVACELADEIRDGKWRHIAEVGMKPPEDCDVIVTELRSRCEGFTRAEYEDALARAMFAPSARICRSPTSTLLYWTIATIFIWGLVVANVGLKKISGWNQWFGFFLYPAMSVFGAVYVLKAKRSGGLAVSILNVSFGVAWMIFEMWAAQAFARSFWK